MLVTRPTCRRFVALPTLTCAGLLAAAASAQDVRLNAPLARPVGGDITAFEIDAEASRVVYVADQVQDELFELFSVKPGAPPIRLRPAAVPGSRVDRFLLSESTRRVVYTVQSGGVMQLFSVPIDGGAELVLGPALVEGGDVVSSTFALSADGRRVLFLADARIDGRSELFSAPVDGSASAVRLTDTPDRIHQFRVTSDSTRVVFQQLRSSVGSALFSVPVDGTRLPVQLTPMGGSANLSFQLTSDSRRVLYLSADALFSVMTDGRGTPLELSAGMHVSQYSLSPDGRRAAFGARPRTSTLDLYSVSVLGGAPLLLEDGIRIDGPLPLEISRESDRVLYLDGARLLSVPILGGAQPLVITGDGGIREFQPVRGGRVVYFRDEGLSGNPRPYGLFSASMDGSSAPLRLASLIVPQAPWIFEASPERVLYRARTAAQAIELFSVPMGGSAAAVKLNGALLAEREVLPGFRVSANGAAVAFSADAESDEVFELFLVAADGSQKDKKLNPELPIGPILGSVTDARLTLDGKTAVYRADQNANDVYELFSVPFHGGVPPVRLNEALTPGGDVHSFVLNAERAVYRADQDVNGVYELFSVPLSGGAAERLNAAGASCGVPRLSPDGQRVVFHADEDGDELFELYSAPSDASAPSVRISPSLGPYGHLLSFAISPLSDRVVIVCDPEQDEIWTLFSCALTGGPALALDDSASGNTFGGVEFSAGGARIVYQLTSGAPQYSYSLRSVLAIGGASPLTLSAGLPAFGSVGNFRLTPDGTQVVYAADGVTDGLLELFRVPVDASAAPVQLHTPAVASFEISPDGAQVGFAVRNGTRYELHSVPTDGSAPARQLTAAMPIVSRHEPFAFGPGQLCHFTPNGARILFTAGEFNHNGDIGLFSVPSDGSAPAIEISRRGSRPGYRDSVFTDYQLTPDGRTVLYRMGSTPITSLGQRLFRAPVDGARPPVRVGRADGSFPVVVHAFQTSPDGAQLLLRAAQDSYRIIELYRAPLRRAVRPGALTR